MNADNASINPIIEDTTVRILAHGKVITIDYDELKDFHKGDSWFGCTSGFRAMQLAARELSSDTLWSRDDISIVSGHPGPGVKDAIELITGTVSSHRFKLLNDIEPQHCNRSMKFEWWVSDGDKAVHIKLHNNIVPESFFALLDRINAADDARNNKHSDDRNRFEQMKADLSKKLWHQSLDTSFEYSYSAIPLTAPPTHTEEIK